MNREELILSCQSTIENLVKKYNNHIVDEDLKSVGNIAVIECVDRCIADKITDESQIQARCNVWAKNRILDEIYKEKLKYTDDEFALDNLESSNDEDLALLILSVKQDLTPKQLRYFELLLDGKSPKEIREITGYSDRTCRYYNAIIIEKIKK